MTKPAPTPTDDTRSKFFNEIDWKLLRQQKEDLLKMLSHDNENSDLLTIEEQKSLDGIVHLIDHIQDTAVDVYGLEERKVFGLRPMEKEIDDKNFVHGMLYAIQELVSQGWDVQAIDIIKNSNISREEFEECQEESGYLTDKVTDVLNHVFEY